MFRQGLTIQAATETEWMQKGTRLTITAATSAVRRSMKEGGPPPHHFTPISSLIMSLSSKEGYIFYSYQKNERMKAFFCFQRFSRESTKNKQQYIIFKYGSFRS